MSDADLPSLSDHLQRQHVALGTFTDLLRREQDLLARAPVPIDELNATTEHKRQFAEQLETLEHRRRQINAARGYGADPKSSQAFAEAETCTDLWDAFMARLETANAHNKAIGAAVEAHLDLTNETLAFLRDNADSGLYTRDGHKQGTTTRPGS